MDPRRSSLPLLAAAVALSCVLTTDPMAQDRSPASPILNKTYRIGSDFLSGMGGRRTPAADPFAAEPPESTEPVRNIQQHLTEELGIGFPEGTFARYDPVTGRLEIQHQPAVVAAIEVYFKAINPGQKSLHIRAEIYQVPALSALRLQHISGPLGDHTAVLREALELVESGRGRLITTAPILVKSGQRALAQDVDEVIYQTEVDWDDDGETVVPAAFETRDAGTIFEVDPVLGPDDYTIDLNLSLEYHTAPPTQRPATVTSPKSGRTVVVEFPEFHCKRVVTQVTMIDGTVKLVGAWRPTGKPEYEQEDVMQIAFIRAHVVTKEIMTEVEPE